MEYETKHGRIVIHTDKSTATLDGTEVELTDLEVQALRFLPIGPGFTNLARISRSLHVSYSTARNLVLSLREKFPDDVLSPHHGKFLVRRPDGS